MKPYEGTKPYIFISYAHADSERVLPILEALSKRGFRLWYDAGIDGASEWSEIIENRLKQSHCVLFFVSPAAMASKFCRRELMYADNRDITIFPVYLEEVTETHGLGGMLESSQALFSQKFSDKAQFIRALAEQKILKPCLDDLPMMLADPRACRLLEKARGGDIEAAFALAEHMRSVNFREKRYEKADIMAWYRRAAEQGHVEAQVGLAGMLGYGEHKNRAESIQWYCRAAEQQSIEAMHALGEIYYHGFDVVSDREEAVRYLTPAAEAGYPKSQLLLGECYRDGLDIGRDVDKARHFFALAAAQGEEDALLYLYLLEKGDLRDLDDEGVFLDLLTASEQGDARAAVVLGHCYQFGWGTDEDLSFTLMCYQQAAKLGDPYGHLALGDCYENGIAVEEDEELSARHYAEAAEKDIPHAQYQLGFCYELGCGVRENERTARNLYRLAAAQGHYAAAKRLKKLDE